MKTISVIFTTEIPDEEASKLNETCHLETYLNDRLAERYKVTDLLGVVEIIIK